MVDSSLHDETIGIVGGGVGGLSAAIHLGASGADVTIYERGDRVGGVMNRFESEGFRFDTGPSWYLIPSVFDRFFERFGHDPSDHFELVRLDPNYRVFWTDGDRADVPADPKEAMALFETYEPGGGEALRTYLEDAAEAYEIGMNRFVMANRSRFRDYLSLDVARSARGLTLLGSMDEHVSTYFEHPKLQQLVQYTLVFLGGSPHNTPSLYKLMSHVDFGLGVYYPRGGMYEVIEAMVAIAEEYGVDIRTNATVEALEPRDVGIDVSVGHDRHRHDRVISNASPAYTELELLPDGVGRGGRNEWAEKTWGPSAFMCFLGVEGDVDPLEHHTLVLPTDWDSHFASIFDEPDWPDDPAYYVNVPSQTDPTVAPDGCETVVILVPIAPGLDDGPDRRTTFREQVLEDLASTTGLDLRDRIRYERTVAVSDFATTFNRPRGTALGLAHTLFQTGPMRPGHRSPTVDRLYYVGGDTNPGIGVPMCLLSGEHVAEAVRTDVESSGLTRLMPW